MAEQTPPGRRNKIIHTSLTMGDQVLQGVDVLPEHYQKTQGFSLSLNIDAATEADRIFGGRRLSANASPGNFLGAPLRHARRSIRHALDDQLWKARCRAVTVKESVLGPVRIEG